MSVINKMLRDLEDRQQKAEVTDYVEKPAPKFLLLAVAAVALMIFASAFTYGVVQLSADSNPSSSEIIEQNDVLTTEEEQKIDADENKKPERIDQRLAQNNSVTSEKGERIQAHASSKAVEKSTALMPESTLPNEAKKLTENSLQLSLDEHLEDMELSSDREETFAQSKKEPTENTFQVTSSKGHSLEVASLRESARLALDDGNKRRAISLLENILALAPDETSARKQLASLLYSEQDLPAALKTLEAGVALQPNDSSMRLMQARIAYRLGNVTEAQNILHKHPSTTLISTELLSFRAALSEQSGDYRQAHSDYKALIAREPNTAKWWLGLAVSQDKLRLSNQAVESYRRVQRLNQLSMQVHDFVKTRIDSLTGQS